MTVRQLASDAGVSVGLISQVERNITDPSLETLRMVAQALGVALFDLFHTEERTDLAVIRRQSRVQIKSPHSELSYSRLSPGFGRLELLEGVLKPGGASSDEPWSHPSEECTVVTSGQLLIEIGEDRQLLEMGDSCYFDSRIPHRYVNDFDVETAFFIAVTPPSY